MKSKPTLADAMQKTAEPKATNRARIAARQKGVCPLLGTGHLEAAEDPSGRKRNIRPSSGP